jgi:hypothetical protein
VPILQSLVLDHLLLHDGPAFWVDANGHARPTTLPRIAPGQRLLDRIHVARGFTAYQHYGAVDSLPEAVDQSIQRRTQTGTAPHRQSAHSDGPAAHRLALVVAPAVDAQYRGDETLSEVRAETLQARTLARLTTYAESDDVAVLVTRSKRDSFSTPIETAADHRLECEQTRMGRRRRTSGGSVPLAVASDHGAVRPAAEGRLLDESLSSQLFMCGDAEST